MTREDTPMTRLEAQPSHTERDLKLSLIAYQVGQLLADAAELYGKPRPEKPVKDGEMLVRLQQQDYADKAARAAGRAIDAKIKSALDAIAEQWEDHSQATFLRMRLADVLTELHEAGELAPVVFFMAARLPERFCDCGRSLDTSAQIDAGQCLPCSERTAR
jgi:hypothetical protein